MYWEQLAYSGTLIHHQFTLPVRGGCPGG